MFARNVGTLAISIVSGIIDNIRRMRCYREQTKVKRKEEGQRSCKMHPSARKSLSHKRERGKKVDSTLLDVKASTLQHVGQPYTVGRAGSTRNKETTKASIRKRFELADVRINFSSRFSPLFFFSSHKFPRIPLYTYARPTSPTRCRTLSHVT